MFGLCYPPSGRYSPVRPEPLARLLNGLLNGMAEPNYRLRAQSGVGQNRRGTVELIHPDRQVDGSVNQVGQGDSVSVFDLLYFKATLEVHIV